MLSAALRGYTLCGHSLLAERVTIQQERKPFRKLL